MFKDHVPSWPLKLTRMTTTMMKMMESKGVILLVEKSTVSAMIGHGPGPLAHYGRLYLTYGTSTSSPLSSLQQSSKTRARTCGGIDFLETLSTIALIL